VPRSDRTHNALIDASTPWSRLRCSASPVRTWNAGLTSLGCASRGYDPATVVAEEVEFGLRELDPSDRRVVGLEYWHASRLLPPSC
jgi:hypothetical protein